MTGSANPRPRIALMGEFSAGKSTLANLLLDRSVSPVKVTATQLPPIWYAYGPPSSSRIDQDGREMPMDLADLGEVSPANTRYVKVFTDADVLDFCDLIDMPGTSDPNMAAEVWERLMPDVDGVVWCTPATQAWRQSEAALWDQMPDILWERSLLLITRMDKVLSERDRARVVTRVSREADGLFKGIFPIELARSVENRQDDAILRETGAEAFVERLLQLIRELSGDDTLIPVSDPADKPQDSEAEAAPGSAVLPRRVAVDPARKGKRRRVTLRPGT